MSVKSVQFAVAAHIMAALGYFPGEEISSTILADSVNADPTFVRKSLSKLSKAGLVVTRSEEHTSELQSRLHLVCRLLLEKKKKAHKQRPITYQRAHSSVYSAD